MAWLTCRSARAACQASHHPHRLSRQPILRQHVLRILRRRRMHQLRALARGLGHRGGSTVLILVVAAGATGPVYYDAARTSILPDTAARAPAIGRGFQANRTGPGTPTPPPPP